MKSNADSPRSLAYYLERAAQCERLAGQAVTDDNRKTLLDLAAKWRFLAKQVEQLPGQE